MISERTVLILGAGASKPYGYPTALELRKGIIENTIPLLKSYAKANNKYDGFDDHPFIKEVKELIEVFRKSSTSSIDLFLSRNKDFYKIGKQIITLLLANYEMNSKFREDINNYAQDWYFNFYESMTKEIIVPDDILKFAENDVFIITFNYDRSLEHFLHESLVNSFRSKTEEFNDLMRKFQIIHVYGKIAPLPWEASEGTVKYGAEYLRDYFTDYSENLQIIYDERDVQTEDLINLISDANKIYFLGFGYAEENLEVLGFNQMILKREQRIYGTAFGMTDQEIRKYSYRLREHNNHMAIEKFQLENCDSLMMLRNNLS